MRKVLGLSLLTLVALTPLLVSVTLAKPESTWDTSHKHYVHGIAVEIEGETWYFEGPGSVRNLFDAIDVPGHKWVQMGPYRVKGLHYSLGPKGMGSWWATGEDSGVLLFVVDGRIAPWNEEISNKMAKK